MTLIGDLGRQSPSQNMLSSKTAVNQDAGDAPETSSARPGWTRISVLMLTLLAAAAALLRFLFLVRKPFWFDECFSAEVSRLSWYDFSRLMWWREANMSLYYLLLRGWLHFGFSPFFIRSLSVVVSLATLPAVFWLSRKLFDRRVALIAVALITFNAYHIRYAQEARSYSLLVLLATLSSGLFVAALQHPSRRNRWGYVLASVLAVYAHLYALLLVAAQWLSVRSWQRTQISRTKVSGTQVVISPASRRNSIHHAWIWIGLAVLPLLAFAAKTGAGPIRWIPQPGFRDVLDFAEHLAGNDGLPLLLLYAAACVAAIIPQEKMTWLLRPGIASNLWARQFLLVWLLFPVGLTLLLSLARPVFLGRYFIFCLPALVILAAAGLARLRRSWMLAFSLAAMLLLSMQGTFRYYDHDFDLERDGSGAAADYILTHAQPGDAIFFYIPGARTPYEFFKTVRAAEDSRSIVAAGPVIEAEIIYPRHGDHLDYRDFTGKPTSDFLRSIPGKYARVWLVLMSNGTPGHPDATTLMINQALGESFSRVEQMQFPEVEVRLYSKP